MFCAPLLAVESTFGPIIEGYGPTYPINDRDVPLQEDFFYRAVFDAAEYRDEKALNAGLVSVARYLNMHGRNGVPKTEMHIAVVAHGPALKAFLNNAAYKSRYGINNPNTELLEKLADAGVHFYICGQSMAFGSVQKNELFDSAKVALSAMTMLTVLQIKGYALLR
jgi:intracellular sulfur oxidation DsrE/DsrF family protein